MLVALAIERLAEVERLLLCLKLDFHRPTGAVERCESAHVRLLFAQIGQHEVPAVAYETFRTWLGDPCSACRSSPLVASPTQTNSDSVIV